MSLILSPAPHIRTKDDTQRLMLNVLIALVPCVIAGIWYFGWQAALVLAVSTASAVLAEFVWQKLNSACCRHRHRIRRYHQQQGRYRCR